MKELIRFDDETQKTFLKEVSGVRQAQVLHHKGVSPEAVSSEINECSPQIIKYSL